MKSIKEIIGIKTPEPKDLQQTTQEEEIFNSYPNLEKEYKEQKEAELLTQMKEKANKLKIENDNLKKLADHRIRYSWAILIFVVLFVIASITTVILTGNKILTINDNVLDILLATNTVQVVGVLYIVAKWLYPTNNKEE